MKAQAKEVNPQEVQDTIDKAFLEQKTRELQEFLVSNKLAIQPLLDVNVFGIRPTVRLVRVPDNFQNGQAQ